MKTSSTLNITIISALKNQQLCYFRLLIIIIIIMDFNAALTSRVNDITNFLFLFLFSSYFPTFIVPLKQSRSAISGTQPGNE